MEEVTNIVIQDPELSSKTFSGDDCIDSEEIVVSTSYEFVEGDLNSPYVVLSSTC
jgi:hypothetical protein